MSDNLSPYAEATRDFDLTDQALRRAYPEREAPVYLPAPVPAPVVFQPTPLPEPGPRVDTLSVRLLAGGGSIALAGLGVDLAGSGVKAAGPYLWALAGALGALAVLIALLKGKSAPANSGTQINISGGKNKFRDVR